MKRTENYAKIRFKAASVNEGFARVCAAAFASQADPTIEVISDIKTAVSEAVTNAIVHAYHHTDPFYRLGKNRLDHVLLAHP